MLVPAGFLVVDDRLVISQWKQADLEGSPLVAQRFRDGRHSLTLRAQGNRQFRLPELAPGRWHDLVYHLRFSTGEDGRVEVWMDGRQFVNATGPTALPGGGERVYHKIGLYRDRWKDPMTIYFDN